MNQSQAGAITPASLDAVDRLRDEDLKGASQGIQKNKEVIVHQVKQQALKQPAMFDRGLNATSDVLEGRDPKTLTVSERFAMERSITSIATMALIGAGIMAAALCAAPLGVIAGRLLFEMWTKHGSGKTLQEDLGELRRARERKKKIERREREGEIAQKVYGGDVDKALEMAKQHEQDMADAEAEYSGGRSQRRKESKQRLKEELQGRKDKQKPKHWSEEDAEDGDYSAFAGDSSHGDTVNLILDQLSDIFHYHTARDFKDNSAEMFATAASCDPHFSMKYLLELAGARDFKESGDGLMFSCDSDEALVELFKNLKFQHDFSRDDDNRRVDFFTGYGCLVSVGRPEADGQYYVRYEGDPYNVRNQ